MIMLYSNVRLPIPEDPRYETIRVRKNDRYLYYRVRSYRDEHGQKKNERFAIGKVFEDALTGLNYFCPNDAYYEKLIKASPPTGAKLKGRGRTAVKTARTYSETDDNVGFGYMIACWKIIKELHLDTLLEDCFGSLSRSIIAVSSFLAAGAPGGLSNIDHFTRKNMCFTSGVIDSEGLSELYGNICYPMRQEFFRKWINRCCADDCICYDVTSISNYSENLPFVSWGYNRDKERLPQFNVGMFCTVQSKLPVYFCSYNGNINDFTNFPYVISQAQDVGLNERQGARFTLVIDGGFAVADAIQEAREAGFDLIVGAPKDFGIAVRDELLLWRSRSDLSDADIFMRGNEAFRYHEIPFTIGRVQTRLLMFKSPKSAIEQETTLNSFINKTEEDLSAKSRMSRDSTAKYKPFFDISFNDKGFSFKLNRQEYKKALTLCGCFALFCTRDDLSAEQVLDLYRAKDCVEKSFTAFKNDILDERIRTKSTESTNGKLFLAFIGLIIRRKLEDKLRTYLRQNRMGLDSAIARLTDIRCIKSGASWVLEKSLTHQQKELAEILQLPLSTLERVNKQVPGTA